MNFTSGLRGRRGCLLERFTFQILYLVSHEANTHKLTLNSFSVFLSLVLILTSWE